MSRTPSKKPNFKSFKDWYQERFNLDPMAALEHFAAEGDDIASGFGINFSDTLNNIRLGNGKDTKLKASDTVWDKTGYRGKTAVYAGIRTDDKDSQIQYPLVTFQTYKDGQHSETLSGSKLLWDLYKRERDIEITAAERAKREQELSDKARKRADRAARIEAKEAAEERIRQASVAADLKAFDSFGAAAPTHKYAKRKKISEAAIAATEGVKMGQDKHGSFLALPLIDISKQVKGLQKIYEQPFKPSPGSDPTDKTFTYGMALDGVFICIGDVWGALEKGSPVAACEGYATGTSWWSATRQPVIVALNSGNLVKVINAFLAWYPDQEFHIAADNDHWKCQEGKGNAGLSAALALVKKSPRTIKAYFPNWIVDELVDITSKPTDWNDVHHCHPNGLKGIRSMRSKKTNRLEAASKPFEFALQELSHVNQYGVDRKISTAISFGLGLFPQHISAKDIYREIFESVAPALDTPQLRKKYRDRIQWLIKKKINTAKKLNGFSDELIKQDNINYISFKPVRRGPGWYEMPDNVLKMVRNLEGSVIIKAPMGSGKTQKLMKPLIHESQKAAYIAHRVSLVASACEKLSDRAHNIHVDNYQNLTAEMMPFIRHMGTCINSAPYAKFSDFFNHCDLICIDEAKQTLSHILDGTIENPVQVFDFLTQVMNSARQTIMCDADANDSLVKFCEKACPGQMIHVIEVETDCSDFKVNFGSSELAYQSVIDSARDGERCLVATDGANSGAQLARDLRMQIPGCRVLMIQRDSNGDKEVEAFQADPDKESKNYDVVIYSPSISSGVSIENNYFTRHYGIFYGVVSPTDAVQMLRRDRFATEFMIGFKRVESRKEINKEYIMLGKMLANKVAAGDDDSRSQWNNYDLTWAEFAASERQACNDFANNMLLMLMANKYQVSRAELNPVMEEQARHSKKLAKEICDQEKIERILSVETPTDEEFERINRRDTISQDDNAKIQRYRIENELQVEVDPGTIQFVAEHGVSNVKRLERALATHEEAINYDSILIKKGVVVTRRTNVSACKRIWDKVIKHTTLDLETGLGDFGAEQARDALNDVLCDETSTAMYNELGIGPYVSPGTKPADATKWVKAIFERFGLTLKLKRVGQKKQRRHHLCLDQHAFMIQFINNRRTADISCLKISLTADEEYTISTQNQTTPAPHTPHDTKAGEFYEQGGPGCSVMDINRNTEPGTGDNDKEKQTGGVDLKGVNIEGVLNDLVRIAIDLDIPLPDTGGETQMFLILLTVELQARLAEDPDLLSGYPEINWINWKGAA